jgi:processive 1,2-diacylglycerol beta-glucosyltransferase
LKILILSASIGEGHDLPARVIGDGIAAEEPEAEVEIVNSLALVNPLVRRLVLDSSRFHSKWGNRLFDLSYRLITDVPPTRWFAARLTQWLAARPIRRAVLERAPDVVVSTYPGSTEVLGDLRARGRIDVPVVSAITDLAALRYWAHPGIDLHLVIHAESAAEVARLAGPGAEIRHVRGLSRPEFDDPPSPAAARAALGLPASGGVVVISGGGWGVGNLEQAARAVLALPGTIAVCLCGTNDGLRRRLERGFAGEPRMRVEGFTERMCEWLAAADALVHSTAGLSVLEAQMCGTWAISYGWGVGHIRANNRAYRRFGLADVAASPQALGAALRRALATPRPVDRSFAALPAAADVVLALIREGGPPPPTAGA